MNETLKALFENAGLPADFPKKAEVLFEAAVNEAVQAQVSAQVTSIQEAAEAKLLETQTKWLAEQDEALETFLDATIVEWAKVNAIPLDATVKAELAEATLKKFKSVLESEGIAMPVEKQALVESANAQTASAIAQAQELSVKLAESNAQLLVFQKSDIVAELTEGLSDVASDKVATLAAALAFTSLDSFRESVAIIAEALGGKAVTEAKKPVKEGDPDAGVDNTDPDGKTDPDADPDAGKGDPEGEGKGKQTNEGFDLISASLQFLQTGKTAVAKV